MIIVEGERSIHIAGQAGLVEESREVAWAEPHVIKNSAYAWVLGKFVETGKANDNGHIFDLEELRAAKTSVLYAPMNMLHVPHKIMGTYVANEIVYPTGEVGAVADGTPYLETLAAFWKFYFPDEFEMVRMAHNEGSLAFSMECVPESVTCAIDDCKQTFAYQGRQSDTYCAHLNGPGTGRRLNKPHFTAGALVVPPALPAWRNAKVTELSTFVETQIRELEAATIAQVEDEFPHLDATAWEKVMAELVKAAGNPFTKGNDKGDKKKKGPIGPHAYAPIFPGGKGKVPCKVCKKPESDPMHKKGAKKPAKDIGLEIARKGVHRTGRPHTTTTAHYFIPMAPSPAMGMCAACGQPATDPSHSAPPAAPPAVPPAAAIEHARDVPGGERKKMADAGTAMPDGSFPIASTSDLRNAIKLAGQAKNPSAARAHIKKMARKLGAENLIPEGW